MNTDKIKSAIRNIPDFPEKGIMFRDITPVLANPQLFKMAVDILSERHMGKDIKAVAANKLRTKNHDSMEAWD